MTWKPLSQRAGGGPDGPFEGVPEHMHALLQICAKRGARALGDGTLLDIALTLRIPVSEKSFDPLQEKRLDELLIEAAFQDEQRALDMVDALLFHNAELKSDGWEKSDLVTTLKNLLDVGGSIWTVSPDGTQLVLAVDQTVMAIYSEAVTPEDEAAKELQEAWANAYGRNGDPSDAWDHAIKAVEDVLIPVVVPNRAKATLGHVLGELGSPQSSGQWRMALPGPDQNHSVDAFVGMLRWLWPNHDRHGGGPRRTPSVEEARMVVTCAALIVQWHRQGTIIEKR